MAQTGFTPILIYSSSTAAAAPSASNLTNSTLGSELAINITDGKLFYKDNGGSVQVIGWKTVPTTAGGTGLTSYTAGDLLYYATGTTLTQLAIGASGRWLGSSGTAPQWNAPAALTKTDDTNVTLTLGGSASTALLNAASITVGWTGTLAATRGGTGTGTYVVGDLLYASSTTALSKLGIGANTTILTSTGSAPQWSAASSLTVGTATNANNINIGDDSTTNATYYPVWVTGTGNRVPYISTAQLTWNPFLAQLYNINGSLKPYGINAYGGITGGTTIGAINFMGSVNANVAPVLEVRQQRSNQDNLVLTTNQNLDAYLLRVQENTADRFVIRGTTAGFGVGIGTATPGYQLQLSADSAAKPTTNTWTIASDRRVKNVLREFTKGLDAICGLRPIVYKYNGLAGFEDLESENISILADEAQKVLPEDVGTFKARLRPEDTEDTELLNWKGHAITFAMVNAIKELKRQLDEVKQQLKERQ